MSFFTFSCILIIISNLIMAIFVLKLGKDRRLSIVWGIFCVVVSIWGFGGYKFSTTISKDSALLWWQVAFTAVILVPVLFYHFVFEYLKLKQRYILMCFYGIAGFFVIVNWYFKEQFLGGVKVLLGELYWVDPGRSNNFLFLLHFILFYIAILSYAFYRLVISYRESTGNQREQMKYFIVAALLGWIGAEFNFLISFGITHYPHFNILIAIYPIIMSYAITHHHLMDITIVVQKSLVYSVLVTIVMAAYSVLVFGAGWLFQGTIGYQSFTVNLFSIFVLAVLFNPLRNQIQKFLDKRFFQGTLETLSQEKQRLQQELFHKEKLAYVGQLASSVVHEIRNPLTAIKTYIDYLPQKYNDVDFKEKFQMLIPKEIARIEKVVNQLLSLAKPRQVNLKPVYISNLIDSTLSLLEKSFMLKRINIKRNYPEIEIVIQGDEEQLRQVFLNLSQNALQAMPEGGELTIGINDLKTTSKVLIYVQDTGCGISEENLRKLFTPFLTTKENGIGLGLSIIQEIIKLHNGTITVASKVGEGAKFSIELPKTFS